MKEILFRKTIFVLLEMGTYITLDPNPNRAKILNLDPNSMYLDLELWTYPIGGQPECIIGLFDRDAEAAVPAGAEHRGVHRTRVQVQAQHPRHVRGLRWECGIFRWQQRLAGEYGLTDIMPEFQSGSGSLNSQNSRNVLEPELRFNRKIHY